MFPDPDALGMSIAMGKAAGLTEQERIVLQLTMEDDAAQEEDDDLATGDLHSRKK